MAPVETGVLELERKKIGGKINLKTIDILENDGKSTVKTQAIEIHKSKSVIIKENAYKCFKRVFDIVCSIVGCLMIIPVAIFIKIAYLLSGDYKSIIYSQKRIGLNGKEFNFYKFRSMVPNADQVLEKLLRENKEIAEEYRINKKLENDPRITKVGNFLRKTSLDELPQFINVIKGDMSIIGPRPYLPREKKDMKEYYDIVIKAKPGLTGLWQVSGRSDVSFEKRLELDEEYEKIKGLKTDSKIFFRTFSAVFGKKGAK